MTTRKVTKKLLKKTSYYGAKEFKRDIEKDLKNTSFGKVLESYRKDEGMTQQEFADLLGTTRAGICDLEKGRVIPSAKRAYAIAKTLEMYVPFCVQLALQDYFKKQKLKLKVSVAA